MNKQRLALATLLCVHWASVARLGLSGYTAARSLLDGGLELFDLPSALAVGLALVLALLAVAQAAALGRLGLHTPGKAHSREIAVSSPSQGSMGADAWHSLHVDRHLARARVRWLGQLGAHALLSLVAPSRTAPIKTC
jgi:hypothetical protein